MTSLIFLIIAIVAVGILLLIAMGITHKRGHTFDVEAYQTKWLKIENSLIRDDPRSYPLAVIEADKLLDHALIELNLPGKTMGDRLKRVGNRFSKLNSVWYAHKLRNQIAHEADFEIDYNQASRSLAAFRQALKDLGAI